VLALIAAALWGGYQWTQTRFFVGAEDGTVVIFRGVQQDIGPISLSTPYQDTGISLDSLSDFTRATVEGTISATSLDDARRIVESISETAGGGE
jgi:protein phosphatase